MSKWIKSFLILAISSFGFGLIISLYLADRDTTAVENKLVEPLVNNLSINRVSPLPKRLPSPTASPTPTAVPQPPSQAQLNLPFHTFQTFNNCGPATLSMVLSFYNQQVSQQVLGQQLRPYQNPQGDNDDKSVTLEELAEHSRNYGLTSYHRPNGSINLIKQFVNNEIPVITRTWLHEGEDIGHYRVVKGYDDNRQELIQDDSYEGNDLTFVYDKFNRMWQPFNYEYLVIVPEEKTTIAEAILGENLDNKTSWENALDRLMQERTQVSNDIYTLFNLSVAHYHLGNYQQSIELFEQVETRLPPRMLWYQIEPIEAYFAAGQYDKLFALTGNILNSGNRAFSELYYLRGKAYLEMNQKENARNEFEQAVYYNRNFTPAARALEKIDDS